MKTLLRLVAFIIIANNSIYSQPSIDIGIYSASFAPNSIHQNTLSIYSFTYSIDNNFGTNETLAPGCVKILVGFPASGLFVPVGGASGVIPGPAANKFNWTMVGNTLKGINNVSLQDGDGGLVGITVIGLIQTPPTTTFTNIFDQGDCTSGNEPGNDSQGAQLEVLSPLPISLFEFNGESKNCDYIHLNWRTSTEVNNDYMEILRSKDGKQFVSIGKVKGTNSIFGDSYSFDDKSELEPGKNYYYRIRQVDLDGKINLHNVILVRYYCKNMIPEMAVFPNPASELINVSFSGLEKDQKTDLIITNKLGTVVKKLNVDTEDISEIQINDLPSGIYKIQTTDFDDNLDYRFIHIK
jgi:hypothetical protein